MVDTDDFKASVAPCACVRHSAGKVAHVARLTAPLTNAAKTSWNALLLFQMIWAFLPKRIAVATSFVHLS